MAFADTLPSSYAALRTAQQRPAIARNLVIVHQPGWQEIGDWHEIGERVEKIDPATRVIVVTCTAPDDKAATLAAGLPSLIFSPGPLGTFKPQRGKVYHGKQLWKFEELKRLAAAGVPVPRSLLLTPETQLDPAIWGEFVILKPTVGSSFGEGVQLIRTERVKYTRPEEFPEKHMGRNGPMVVQQFINTGEHTNSYRVLTLFGEALYCLHVVVAPTRVDLTSDDTTIEAAPISHQSSLERDRFFVYDADVVALARRAHWAIPEIPLKGIDIVREAATGKLYVLEVNPRSNTWHFSSDISKDHGPGTPPPPIAAYKAQLDAFGTAAYVLADVVRREAV
jgi:hypothetical protein